MSLNPGTRLGPYEILGAIGAGGMGEVYRAKDTKLDREVAIKVLPEALALDPDRRVRFEREAKAVAALSHPNILAIFDFGVHDAVAYAAMELLSGETLRERMRGGALPLRKATETAVQVARGLAAAHDKGLVHRDLKPENIFLLGDGQVKILDFGLAKAVVAGPDQSVDSETIAGTDPGTVLGTVGYMSPEQIRGQTVDARSDLFSLGAVLYEMLTGQRAFHRDTAAESMTAILKEDPPDMVSARADLPGSLDRIVRHCLEKNPAERFQTARDIAFALEALSGSGTARVPSVESMPGRGTRPLARAAAIVLTAIAGLTAGWFLRAPAPPAVRTLDMSVEGLQVQVDRVPVVSPDGNRVLYFAEGRVWVRELDGLDPIELAGTEGASYASWAPDSRAVALVKGGRLVRMPIDGGTGVALGNAPVDMLGSGATLWLPDGRILLVGSDTRGVTEVSDRGGDLKDVVPLDKNAETDFHELAPLPDGRGVIYTVHRMATGAGDTIEAFTDGARHVVLQLSGETLRRPVYSPTGHLLYQRETTTPGIWAVKKDGRGPVSGGARRIVAIDLGRRHAGLRASIGGGPGPCLGGPHRCRHPDRNAAPGDRYRGAQTQYRPLARRHACRDGDGDRVGLGPVALRSVAQHDHADDAERGLSLWASVVTQRQPHCLQLISGWSCLKPVRYGCHRRQAAPVDDVR